MLRILTTFSLMLFLAHSVNSQILSPKGVFSQDSIKIGEEVNYSLSIRYPSNMDIIFPDSNYIFLPFEFIRKQAFPTKSDSLYSFDSAVYTFTTFEIDSIQIINLPVFLVTGGDSLVMRPDPDSLVLFHVVESIPDSISMIENTKYSNVNLAFNYPYLVVGITSLLIIGILVFFIFGKTIRKRITLYRLKRMHKQFLEKFNIAIRDLKSETDYRYFEHMLGDWKGYMEKLNKAPYTKLTSKEIEIIYPDKQLQESLKAIDKAIYGGLRIQNLPDSFDYLRRISEDSYHNKFEEIRNG